MSNLFTERVCRTRRFLAHPPCLTTHSKVSDTPSISGVYSAEHLCLMLGLGMCMHFAIPDVFMLGFLPLLILSATYGSQRTDTLLTNKPLQRLGDLSFSVYLVHQPLLFAIGSIMAYQARGKPVTGGPPAKPDMLTGWLMCLAFIALTLLVASLTHRFIEVPARYALNARFRKSTTRSLGTSGQVAT